MMTNKQTTGFMWFMLESIFKLSCDVKLCWIIKLSHRGCCDLENFENSIPSSKVFFVAVHQSSASCWEFSILHVSPRGRRNNERVCLSKADLLDFKQPGVRREVNLATHQLQTHSEQLPKFLRGSTHKTLPARWREFGEGVPDSLSRQMPPKRRHSIFIAWENTFRERKVSSRGAGSNHPIYFDFDLITHIRSSHRVAKKKFISVDRRSALRRIEMSLFCVYFRFGGVGRLWVTWQLKDLFCNATTNVKTSTALAASRKLWLDLDVTTRAIPATRKIESQFGKNSFQTMESGESRISAEYLRVNQLCDWKQLRTGALGPNESIDRPSSAVAIRRACLQSRSTRRPWPRSADSAKAWPTQSAAVNSKHKHETERCQWKL